MLTKKEVSKFRKNLEKTKCGEDFMTDFLRKESVRYLKQLEEKIGEKESEVYRNRERGTDEADPMDV